MSTITEPSASARSERRAEGANVETRRPGIALFFATACGLGYFPLAPGTWGSLGGLMIALLPGWILYARPSILGLFANASSVSIGPFQVDPILTTQCALAVVIAVVGVWSASRVSWFLQKKDPGRVVIDEVSGQHLTLLIGCALAVPNSNGSAASSSHNLGLITSHSALNWKYWLVGFILFRALDVWKPFPARQAESLPGGWGIMADDWAAGVYAGVALWLARLAGL
jgi:phosphatidylglycerophosphatase A